MSSRPGSTVPGSRCVSRGGDPHGASVGSRNFGSRDGSRCGSRAESRGRCTSAGGGAYGGATFPHRFAKSNLVKNLSLPTIDAGHELQTNLLLEEFPVSGHITPRRSAQRPELDNVQRGNTYIERCSFSQTDSSWLGLSPLLTPKMGISRSAIHSAQQCSMGDYGHAAAYIARTRKRPIQQTSRQRLVSQMLSTPSIRRLGSTPIEDPNPNSGSLFYAPAFPARQRRVALSEDVASETLVTCIKGLKKDPKLVTTEDITQRLFEEGWLADEVQELLALGAKRMKELWHLTRLPPPKKATLLGEDIGMKTAPDMPYSCGRPPLLHAELIDYLKEQLRMLPVVVSTFTSGEGGCMVLLNFRDTHTSKAAGAHLHGKLQDSGEFHGCRALREGRFVQLIIDDCKHREDVDKLVQFVRGTYTLRPNRAGGRVQGHLIVRSKTEGTFGGW